MVKIKVCGITNIEDALAAVEAGADAVGFIIFKGSKRYISPLEVRHITKELPPFVTKVGVFVNEDRATVLEILSYANLDFAQLHGDETPEYCRYIGKRRVIKVFRLKDETEVKRVKDYENVASAILLDTFSQDAFGGTGKTFDWNIALKVKEAVNIPLILSGGLNSENVSAAIENIRPYAVDVCSGVESHPGKKDREAVEKFIRTAKCKG
ncbi:phosphoribosylanthranilate isomerase [Desulfurobacterium sp.]